MTNRELLYTIIVMLAITTISVFVLWLKTDDIRNRLKEDAATISAQEAEENRLYQERKARLVAKLTTSGSLYAEEIAIACMSTAYPEALCAISIKETNGNPYLSGDNGDAYGAFQVQRKWWGPVPADINKQAWQAEWVLDSLLHIYQGDMRKALAHYNGGYSYGRSSMRYADDVLAIAR